MTEPSAVELVHLRWLARTTLPVGMSLPRTLAKAMHAKGWIEWAVPPYIIPDGSPYSSARISSQGRAVLVVHDLGKAPRGKHLPYPHGREWPWTLPEFRDQFVEEIAYTERRIRETR